MKDNNKWMSQDGIGMSFQEYANMQGITYEAVRRQTLKHQAALEGHIIQRSNAKYLDDYAVDFLQKNSRKPLAQTEDSKHIREQLKLLHQDISGKMMISIEDLQHFISDQQELALLRSENEKLKQANKSLKQSFEDLQSKYDALDQKCNEFQNEISILNERIDNARDYRNLLDDYIRRLTDHETLLKTNMERIGTANDIMTEYIRKHKWVETKDKFSLDDDSDDKELSTTSDNNSAKY